MRIWRHYSVDAENREPQFRGFSGFFAHYRGRASFNAAYRTVPILSPGLRRATAGRAPAIGTRPLEVGSGRHPRESLPEVCPASRAWKSIRPEILTRVAHARALSAIAVDQ